MPSSKTRIGVIVPAAGSGNRLKSKTPKPYVMLSGVPLLIRTLQSLKKSLGSEAKIVISVSPGRVPAVKKLLTKHRLSKCDVIEGGATRAQSVYNAYNVLKDLSDVILIHDAARPFLKDEPISEGVITATKHGAVILAKKADATVKQSAKKTPVVRMTLDRSRIYLAQTPQLFRTDVLEKAYRKAGTRFVRFTDEAGLVEYSGYKVRLVEGTALNFKITQPEDLKLADLMVKHRIGI